MFFKYEQQTTSTDIKFRMQFLAGALWVNGGFYSYLAQWLLAIVCRWHRRQNLRAKGQGQ